MQFTHNLFDYDATLAYYVDVNKMFLNNIGAVCTIRWSAYLMMTLLTVQ